MKNVIDRVREYSKNNPYGFTLSIETMKPLKFGICAAYAETKNCFSKQGLEKAKEFNKKIEQQQIFDRTN